MIQVKTFVMSDGNSRHHENLDKKINNFIAQNDIEVVDVKYSTSMYERAALMSAMVIFKTDQPLEK